MFILTEERNVHIVLLEEDGTLKNWETPVQVVEMENIKDIASGRDHFLALDDKGIWAMGDDTYG